MRKWACNVLNHFQSLSQAVERYQYVSFDIFDTLIIRKSGEPKKIFRLIEDRYNRSHEVKLTDFYNVRIDAEKSVRKKTNKQEVTIDDIYIEIEKFYHRDKVKELKLLEHEIEHEECIGRQDVIKEYNRVIKEKKVFIISDMYLSSDFIKTILVKNDIALPEKIFVSSFYDATKRDTSLFRIAIREIGCDYSQIIHVGDNMLSDFLYPKMLGMHSYIVNRR